MIYLTGDLHGRASDRLSPDLIPDFAGMDKNDYVIVLGDFGLILDFRGETDSEKAELDRLEALPFTVLFIDGNHENFDRLNRYPQAEWHGGTVHMIRPHVLHLTRGQVFTLQGKTFFTFGGGKSHHIGEGVLDPFADMDKLLEARKDPARRFRVNHISWWKEEMPDSSEMESGIRHLQEHHYAVDYILTHTPPSGVLDRLNGTYTHDSLSDYLETEIRQKTDYSHWYAAHLHRYAALDGRDFILFRELIRVV